MVVASKNCILDLFSNLKSSQLKETCMQTKSQSDRTKEDADLVALALKGSEQAFARLMIKYRTSIYRVVHNIVKNKNDAEDLTLEAFGKAFANLYLFSPDYAFSTWIYRIATNHSIDFLRKKRGIYYSLGQDEKNGEYNGDLLIKSTSPNPEERMIIKQRAVMLRRFIEKLKPHYRLLIELRYFKEYSYEEMAKELDLPLGTVKVQLFRARNTLYEIIRETEVKD